MLEKIQKIEDLRVKLLQGGGSEAKEIQHKSGKLTARERIERLLDQGTFLEIDLFSKPINTGMEIDKNTVRGDGLISGYGEVNGRPICIWAQDATVLGGRAGITHLTKMVTLMERALKSRIPCVGIIDSEGLRVEDMITTPTSYSYGRMMDLQVKASGVIPQIALIMGPCVGAPSISAQLCDFVFMTRDSSYSCISLPKEVSPYEMGGAQMHFQNSGCCDVLADSDEDCIEKVKELLSLLPLNSSEKLAVVDTGDSPEREVPEVLDIVPDKSEKLYDMHRLINVFVDNRRFFEIRKGWAMNLIVGFARLGGRAVGIIANNPSVKGGCLDVDSADKLARFVRFCDAFNIPLVYIADTPAFLPAVEQEQKGIIRHGSKAIFSNSVATNPRVQIYVRKCYGGGNLAMPGSSLGGDFGLAWPIAELLLMQLGGAVSILYRKEISAAENPKEEFKKRLKEFQEAEAVGEIWEARTVQDIINPKDTRSKLIRVLETLENKVVETVSKRNDNMPL